MAAAEVMLDFIVHAIHHLEMGKEREGEDLGLGRRWIYRAAGEIRPVQWEESALVPVVAEVEAVAAGGPPQAGTGLVPCMHWLRALLR